MRKPRECAVIAVPGRAAGVARNIPDDRLGSCPLSRRGLNVFPVICAEGKKDSSRPSVRRLQFLFVNRGNKDIQDVYVKDKSVWTWAPCSRLRGWWELCQFLSVMLIWAAELPEEITDFLNGAGTMIRVAAHG